MNSTLPALLFLVPFLSALLCGALGGYLRGAARWIALGALAATAALSFAGAALAAAGERLVTHMGGWAPPLGIEWRLDALSAFVAAFVAATALIVHGALGDVRRRELGEREPGFNTCALLLVSGLMGMIASADLFNLFVHLEVASLSAYALVASGGRGAPRAAVRYLVIGSLGASLYLLGVGHVYAATGTLNMDDAAARIAAGADPRLTILALAFMISGLAIKMGLFPLHGWMPGAYARAPLSAAALMAPLVTKVSAYALIRILFWVYGPAGLGRAPIVADLLCVTGAVALIAGALLAAREADLRRLLAYSSVSQMGLVVLGIGLANAAALTGAILHLANDALMKATLFVGAAELAHRFGVREVGDLARVRARAPWTAAAMAVAAFSLVGLPPLCGFFGKWYVLMGALESGRPGMAFAIVAGSLASAFYAFRIVERLYFARSGEACPEREGPAGLVAACALLGGGVAALGLGSDRVVALLVRAAIPGGV
ncbi:MAG: hydrogenase 4 subunit B [Planctomycetes bacterium]|nr:hydrogenase 4 subunit B [Planctomycetota bacterium]